MPQVVPVVASAASWVGTTLAAGGVQAFLLRSAGSLLLSAAANALMPKPGGQSRSRGLTLRAPAAPRDVVYGRVRKGGTVVFAHVTGARDQYLHLVVALAGHEVAAIGGIWFDGVLAISASGLVQTRWAGLLSVEKALGTEGQPAFAGLVAAAPSLWTFEHRLAGTAAIHLRLTADANAFPGGIPNITVEIDGCAGIEDPRTGATGYSSNAALCLAHYITRSRYGPSGGGVVPVTVDAADLIEAANVCDEAVALAAGGSEPRYSCNGSFPSSTPPKAAIEALLTAMAGTAVRVAGAWRIHAGAWRQPVLALGEADIRAGGIRLTTRVSMAANCNRVRGTFVSPENDWQPDDFPAVTSAVYLSEDNGEERWRDIALPFTTSAPMAQRLAKIELERTRRQMSVQLAGQLSAWGAEVGEVVTLTRARWGLAAKPFEVRRVALDLQSLEGRPALLPELTLQETSPLVYDWSASEEQIYDAAPRTMLPSAFDIASPGTPEISEALYVTRDGGALKIKATIGWAEAPSATVATYQVDASFEGGTFILVGRTDKLSIEHLDIAAGLWTWRVKAISSLGVASAWKSRTVEILGLSAPPAALAGVTIQTLGGMALLKWDKSPDADVRLGGAILIRHSTATPAAWANSVSMDRVAGSEGLAVVAAKPGTYLLRPEDSGGRLGPVVSLATKGAQALAFAPVGEIIEDPGFAGAGTEVTVVGGALQLATRLDGSGQTVTVAPEALYAFPYGMDFGAVRRIRLRSRITVTATVFDDLFDARSAPIDLWADFDGAEGALVDVVVEYRETDDDPALSPVWGPWGRIDSHEIEARAVEFRAWLRSSDPGYSPLVSTLRVTADEVA